MDCNLLKNNTLLFSFRGDLLKWYHQHKRDLPWRQRPDFYHVWISEIVLQQTQVIQGLDYYLRFIKKFSNVKVLAAAKEDEVLKMWEGLGYYSRARNLHFAAKQIVALGGFPKTYTGWLAIKGVGPYTAAAISSIVCKEPRAVVDGNVQRVLSRLLNYSDSVNSTKGIKEIQKMAQELLEVKEPGDYNQALMELGARVCKPKNPNCIECPIRKYCLARKEGTMFKLPVKEKKVKVRNRFLNFYILINEGKVLLQKRGAGDIWEGLYQFPLIETKEVHDNPNPVKEGLIKRGDAVQLELLWQGKHLLTHQRLHINCWILKDVALKKVVENAEWYSAEGLKELALPRPLGKIISEYLLVLF